MADDVCEKCGAWNPVGLECMSCKHVSAARPPTSAAPMGAPQEANSPSGPAQDKSGGSKIVAIVGVAVAVAIAAGGAFMVLGADLGQVQATGPIDQASIVAPTTTAVTTTTTTTEAPPVLAMVAGSVTDVQSSYCDNPGFFADAPAPVEGAMNSFVTFASPASRANGEWQYGTWRTKPELNFDQHYADYLVEYGLDAVTAAENPPYALCVKYSEENSEPIACDRGDRRNSLDVELYSLSTGELVGAANHLTCFELADGVGEHVLPYGHSVESLTRALGADQNSFCSNPVALAGAGSLATKPGIYATGLIRDLDNDSAGFPGTTTHIACEQRVRTDEFTSCDGYQQIRNGALTGRTFEIRMRHVNFEITMVDLATGEVVAEEAIAGDASCPLEVTVTRVSDQAIDATQPDDKIQAWLNSAAAEAFASR